MAGIAASASRLRRAVRRYGACGALRRSLELAGEIVHDDRTYVWYQLRLGHERPRRELGEGLELVEATDREVSLLDELWAIDRAEALRRLADGGRLWLVVADGLPAFSCWTFGGRTPIRAVTGGWLALPDDTTCLEESLTAAAFRGRGIAPAAWTAVFDRLEEEGPKFRRVVTAIEEENAASRRAVEKIGFAELGRMGARRRVGRTTVRIDARDTDAAFLHDGVGGV